MDACWNARKDCFALILLLPFLTGCEDTFSIVTDDPASGIIYDTKYEEMLKKGAPPVAHAGWGPYVETLDEPVAIVDWRNGVSTWEVFFATNRQPIKDSMGTDQVRHGRRLSSENHFGRAEITIPKRRRGVDPKREEAGAEAGKQGAVVFEQITSQDWSETAAGICAQVDRSRQKDLLLFVHGFNVDFESALIRTAQISLDIPFNGAVVSYCWPSQGGVLSYEVDEEFNADSTAPFAEFLEALIAAVPPETRINIVVHSMGNRIVMQAINRLPAAGKTKPLAQVVLCAPDVGLSDFRRWAPGVAARSEGVTLYASKGDAALTASKSLHFEARAGGSVPVVMEDIDTVECSDIDFDLLGHSYYGGNIDVLSDLFAVLKQRESAAQRSYLTERTAQEGRYWRYKARAPKMLWNWNFDEEVLKEARRPKGSATR